MYHEPIAFSEAAARLPATYVHCTLTQHLARNDLARCAQRAAQRGWRVKELVSTHGGWHGSGEVEVPENPLVFFEAVDLLLRIAQQH